MPVKKMKVLSLIFSLSLIFLLFARVAFAEEKTVTLKDGSVLVGEVLGKVAGFYRIRTASLGMVNVKEENVASIDYASSAGSPASQIDVYQRKIATNPDIMASVRDLSNDKEVVQMMSDPEFTSALMRQDTEFLKNDPRFIKFSQNPSIQKIVQQLLTENAEKEGYKK